MTQVPELEHTILEDGTALTIRPIRPDDAPRLQAFHARLSPETIYWRYLCPHPKLSAAEAERFTNVDYQHRMAFVAIQAEQEQEDVIGVARYECLRAGHADQAELAIVVEDRFQRRGIGTILLAHLTNHARTHGIRALVAEISAQNQRMLNFMRRSGLPTKTKLEDGVIEMWMILN
jgi:RimJ/RimL family protein N-acetyltransferase